MKDEKDENETTGATSARAGRRQPRKPAPDPAGGGFYAPGFSRQERASLAAITDSDTLADEIALLKIVIRRQLTRPPSDCMQDGGATLSLNALEIRRSVEVLCRAIKTRRSETGNTLQDKLLDEFAARIWGDLQPEEFLKGETSHGHYSPDRGQPA